MTRTFYPGDRVRWNDGQRLIHGTVIGMFSDRDVQVQIDEADRRQPWPCQNELLPERMLYPTWSERLQKL